MIQAFTLNIAYKIPASVLVHFFIVSCTINNKNLIYATQLKITLTHRISIIKILNMLKYSNLYTSHNTEKLCILYQCCLIYTFWANWLLEVYGVWWYWIFWVQMSRHTYKTWAFNINTMSSPSAGGMHITQKKYFYIWIFPETFDASSVKLENVKSTSYLLLSLHLGHLILCFYLCFKQLPSLFFRHSGSHQHQIAPTKSTHCNHWVYHCWITKYSLKSLANSKQHHRLAV